MKRLALFIGVVFFCVVGVSSPVSAQSPFPTYTQTTPGISGSPGPAQLKDLETVFARIIAIATVIAIFAFFIMFVVAAFKFLTGGGDPISTESARNTMTYAFIGIGVVVGSYILLGLLQNFTGIPLTVFTINTGP